MLDLSTMSEVETPLKRAIKAVGGLAGLAKPLGISEQAVSQWDEVPPLRVLAVERVTGVPRHELRPDLYPPESSESSASIEARA